MAYLIFVFNIFLGLFNFDYRMQINISIYMVKNVHLNSMLRIFKKYIVTQDTLAVSASYQSFVIENSIIK